jgi:hypothetical protein
MVIQHCCSLSSGVAYCKIERMHGATFQLKHHELNDAIIVNLSTREFGPGDALKLCSMFVKIVERLVLRFKGRLKQAHLPNCAYRHDKSNCLPLT